MFDRNSGTKSYNHPVSGYEKNHSNIVYDMVQSQNHAFFSKDLTNSPNASVSEETRTNTSNKNIDDKQQSKLV